MFQWTLKIDTNTLISYSFVSITGDIIDLYGNEPLDRVLHSLSGGESSVQKGYHLQSLKKTAISPFVL